MPLGVVKLCSQLHAKFPLVSVIIPVYNAEAYIGQALSSALSQTYRNIEVIVVDDGSKDQTAHIVQAIAEQDHRVTLLQQPNRGVAAARNLAIETSKGEFIAPLDADDVWYPEKIEKQVKCMLEAGPSVGLVYTWWVVIDEAGTICFNTFQRQVLNGRVFPNLINSNIVGNASVPLIRRACLEQVGYYRDTRAQGAQGCEDWDLCLRIAEQCEFRLVPAYLVGYRDVQGSMSSVCGPMKRSYDLMIEEVRRRHPEIPETEYQRYRSKFYVYLSVRSYDEGHYAATFRWAYRAWRLDPQRVRTWHMLIILSTSLPLAIVGPLVSLIWPHSRLSWRWRRAWLRLKYNLKASFLRGQVSWDEAPPLSSSVELRSPDCVPVRGRPPGREPLLR